MAGEDIVVRDTTNNEALDLGVGLVATGGAGVTLTRSLFERNRALGLTAVLANNDGIPTTLNLVDLTVRDTLSAADGEYGRGLDAYDGASVTLTRGSFEGNREAGIIAFGWQEEPQTTATLKDVSVSETRFAACGEIPEGEPGSCIFERINYGGGSGIAVVSGAELTLERFWISGSAQVGLRLESDSSDGAEPVMLDPEVDAERGVVTSNAIGLNVEVAGYDWHRISDEVFVFDNGLDYASRDLPPPSRSRQILPY